MFNRKRFTFRYIFSNSDEAINFVLDQLNPCQVEMERIFRGNHDIKPDVCSRFQTESSFEAENRKVEKDH